MENNGRVYAAIDLKSFYASVECVERGLDPLDTNLVVADESRTQKTICLAVSPTLKACGISGRARLFEVVERIKQINSDRRLRAENHRLKEKSHIASELKSDKTLEVSYITAPPRMAYYMDYSRKVYSVYLKYAAPEDIHTYSIDEVFIDLTSYLKTYDMTPRELTMTIIKDVLKTTGITATAGIGTNLYLAKVAMDIVAKHMPADSDGVRIAELDEMSYRRLLWNHEPITDFWRVGRGYARRLYENGMYTMGDVARCSVGKPSDFHNEELLYKLFGINAELLIDHAWGIEPCTMEDIKTYKPETNSLSSGQVLMRPYDFEKARIVVREMADAMSLELFEKGLVTDQLVLNIGYDIECMTNPKIRKKYKGEVTADRYGRKKPKHSHGTENLGSSTFSSRQIIEAVTRLYDRTVNPDLLIRRITVIANRVIAEESAEKETAPCQMDLFTDYNVLEKEKELETAALEKEKRLQGALLDIKKKYGKNAVLKGMSFCEGATGAQRNRQIGGHRA